MLEDAEFIDRGESGGVTSLNYINLTYALGWEVQPNFETNLVLLDEGEGGGFLLCQLKEGINFQNGAALPVDSLIALVDYAKLQPTNTLIYQTWAPLMITKMGDYSFILGVDLDNLNFGYMDVMYNLASPQGSVVFVGEDNYCEQGFAIGTGAYQVDEAMLNLAMGEPFVRFERWEGWWDTETVPTQYVTFQYESNSTSALNDLFEWNSMVSVIRYTEDQKQELMEWVETYEEWSNLLENWVNEVEGNPLALFFNENEENSIFGDDDYRKAVTAALNKDRIRLMGGLDYDSNDFWSYLRNEDSTNTLPVNDLEYAQSLIEDINLIIGLFEIDVVVYDSDYFDNDTYQQGYDMVCDEVERNLTALFGYYDITVNMITASESEMAAYEANGNYDIMLKEIDLHNVNSAYNLLYGKGNNDVDEWLEYAINALDVDSYMLTHLAAQYYNYKDAAFITNLGWQKNAVIQNPNVSGVQGFDGFCPTGDLSMLDFRFICVSAN